MMKEKHMRGSNSNGDMNCSSKLHKVNWSEHANAHNNFSSQDKFLNANFLFSLSTQKPQTSAAMGARSVVCQVQDVRMHNVQLEKAWQGLSNLQLSSRSYVKPGQTLPLSKNVNASLSHSSRRTTQQCSSDLKSTAAGCNQNYQSFIKVESQTSKLNKSLESSCPPHSFDVKKGSSSLMGGTTQMQAINCKPSESSVHTNAWNSPKPSFSDGIDDDDILENIDVDQIVLDHYQSTPQPSTSKIPPITPYTNKENLRGDEAYLPPELCLMCSHRCKLGLCPEASSHLQAMKDTLIAISNDLIDNVDEMSSDKVETLRQERQQLKKQIQQLEKYLQTTSVNEKRKMSHFSV